MVMDEELQRKLAACGWVEAGRAARPQKPYICRLPSGAAAWLAPLSLSAALAQYLTAQHAPIQRAVHLLGVTCTALLVHPWLRHTTVGMLPTAAGHHHHMLPYGTSARGLPSALT